jgi:hypothetical protein
MVADTFITWPVGSAQERNNRRPYENAMPKIVIARSDLAVGLAGDDAVRYAQEIVEARELPVTDMVAMLRGLGGQFVVTSLNPQPQLYQIRCADVQSGSSMAWAWAGDEQAYKLFRRRRKEMETAAPQMDSLMTSMQWILSFRPVPSVGGYMTRLATTANGFRFEGDPTMVNMPLMVGPDGTPMPYPDDLQISYQIVPGVGCGETFGANAYWIPQSSTVRLFRHATPWKVETYRAGAADDVVAGALIRGQEIALPPAAAYAQVTPLG